MHRMSIKFKIAQFSKGFISNVKSPLNIGNLEILFISIAQSLTTVNLQLIT